MSTIKPRIFQGTRDFLPEEMIRRQRIVDTVKAAFQRYGFLPVETPAIEFLDILTGKYGDEGDKLIYRLAYKGGKELALRYDQTVPLSRLIAMYHQQLPMPFKRYQVQPVWRADRPQKGRFREFYQLDADTVGSPSYLADAEIIALANDIFTSLGFPDFTIRINHRMALRAITLRNGLPIERELDVCRIIDKMDKFSEKAREDIVTGELFNLAKSMGKNEGDAWKSARGIFNSIDVGQKKADAYLNDLEFWESDLSKWDLKGMSELKPLYQAVLELGVPEENISIDPSLARGLDYYTGPIFEVVLENPKGFGSVAGGGRYDRLIGTYSGVDIPATGISFGLDRIYGAMEELSLHDDAKTTTKVLVINFGGDEEGHAMQLAGRFREAGIPTEVYFDAAKLKKQFGYADKRGIPWVAIRGEDERAADEVSIKDLRSGDQQRVGMAEAIELLKA